MIQVISTSEDPQKLHIRACNVVKLCHDGNVRPWSSAAKPHRQLSTDPISIHLTMLCFGIPFSVCVPRKTWNNNMEVLNNTKSDYALLFLLSFFFSSFVHLL